MENFVLAVCLQLALSPCPVYEVTEAKPIVHGKPAFAMTQCGKVWQSDRQKRVCFMVFQEATFNSTRLVDPLTGNRWTVGKNVVLHELCHAYEYMKLESNIGHKTGWKRCMRRVRAWGADLYDRKGNLK